MDDKSESQDRHHIALSRAGRPLQRSDLQPPTTQINPSRNTNNQPRSPPQIRPRNPQKISSQKYPETALSYSTLTHLLLANQLLKYPTFSLAN
jgi:hypothetical protein